MKTLLTIVLILLCESTAAYSLCSGGGLSVFPHGSTIGSHPIFVLEGYAKSQKVITGLNKAYSIYLNSGKSKVRLMVRTMYVGQYGLTQALLYPEAELEVGQEYTLQIDSLPHGEHLARYNHAKEKYGPVTYNVVAGNDNKSPSLSSRPEEVGKTLENPGCGPVSNVAFSNPALDESEVIVMTTVKNLSSGKETTYLILPDSNKIRVGHGMCSGAFIFDIALEYEVEFTFMDAAGNITPWTGERIRFTKPTKETG